MIIFFYLNRVEFLSPVIDDEAKRGRVDLSVGFTCLFGHISGDIWVQIPLMTLLCDSDHVT